MENINVNKFKDREKILEAYLIISNYFRHAGNSDLKYKLYPFVQYDYAYLTDGALLIRYPNDVMQYAPVDLMPINIFGKTTNFKMSDLIDFTVFDNLSDGVQPDIESFKHFRNEYKCDMCKAPRSDLRYIDTTYCEDCFDTGINQDTGGKHYVICDNFFNSRYVYLIYRYLPNLVLYSELHHKDKRILSFTYGHDNQGHGLLMPLVY